MAHRDDVVRLVLVADTERHEVGTVAVEARIFPAPYRLAAGALWFVRLQLALRALAVEVPDGVRRVSEKLVAPRAVRLPGVAEQVVERVLKTTAALPPSAIALQASAHPEMGDAIDGWHAAS